LLLLGAVLSGLVARRLLLGGLLLGLLLRLLTGQLLLVAGDLIARLLLCLLLRGGGRLRRGISWRPLRALASLSLLLLLGLLAGQLLLVPGDLLSLGLLLGLLLTGGFLLPRLFGGGVGRSLLFLFSVLSVLLVLLVLRVSDAGTAEYDERHRGANESETFHGVPSRRQPGASLLRVMGDQCKRLPTSLCARPPDTIPAGHSRHMIFTILDMPIGPLAVAWNDAGAIAEIRFFGRADPGWARDDSAFDDVTAQLDEYFAERRQTFDLPLAPEGTTFQLAVWRQLTLIPYGETRSYLDVANAIGRPAACRAVGAANGANPLPIVLPCHRVIGSNGSLTGFGGGLSLKRQLLGMEARAASPLFASRSRR
jgi:methylated-DNA-[protein]-cysteine S-methyltransferase